MIYILIGCLAFVLFYIFELNKIKLLNKHLYVCFVIGFVILVASTILILFSCKDSFNVPIIIKTLFGLISAIMVVLIFYSLFLAIPGEAYKNLEQEAVINKGMYALCRHPGVIWIFLFYLFLWLASGKSLILWAGITWSALNIIYVYTQDRWFFPKTIRGYERYKHEVPFLIPTIRSMQSLLGRH
jgi:protein-S-isoprenylcysteine O-methyltransferase Ste14